eukprot:4138534-Amphidinium_carterae.1
MATSPIDINDIIPSERPSKDSTFQLHQDVVLEVFLRARSELVREHDVVLTEQTCTDMWHTTCYIMCWFMDLRAALEKLRLENEHLRHHGGYQSSE